MSDDPDELRARGKQLAKDLLAGMQQPTSPERAEYERHKEQQDEAALEDYYRRTGQTQDRTPRARTTTEMQFAASLEPCAHCGTTEPTQLDLVGGGDYWTLTGQCSRCDRRRLYGWATEGNPLHGACPMAQLGDARPSQIIRVGQFMRELDRLLPVVHAEPAELEPVAWRASLAAMHRAITCLYELLKFVPANMKIIPDTNLDGDERRDRAMRRERYGSAWLQSELDRLLALEKRYVADAPRIWALEEAARPPETPTRGAIDRASLMAHQNWVRAGFQGPGRLDVVGYHGRELRLAAVQFERAYLERVMFDRAVLEAARMTDCELRDVSVREAFCASIQLVRAKIVRGTFERTVLALAVFDEATIEGTSFTLANLERSQWRGAVVTDARFERAFLGNSRLDGGTFRGCSFVNADFHRLVDGIMATSTGVRFEDCDLRGTRWDGHDLSGATFVRCKLAGIRGRPTSVDGVTIEAPDLSPAGDGSMIGSAADVLARWAAPP